MAEGEHSPGERDQPIAVETTTFSEADLDPSPIQLFGRWFQAAQDAQLPAPESVALAPADRRGRPSARMVLLKDFDERGFVFYTNYESRKGGELAENPYGALLFYWQPFHRQVRLEGPVSRTSAEESDHYFN